MHKPLNNAYGVTTPVTQYTRALADQAFANGASTKEAIQFAANSVGQGRNRTKGQGGKVREAPPSE
jgi:hypothetical protein